MQAGPVHPHQHLIDPLLDAIDACMQDHTTPAASTQAARQLLDAYLAAARRAALMPAINPCAAASS